MSWVPAERVLATVAAQRQVLAEQRARMDNVAQFHATERQKTATEGIQAANDLASSVLPSLAPAAIASAAQLVGLPALPGEDIPRQVEVRRHWLRDRLSAILKDPRYANAELLRHPRTGTHVIAIAEAQAMRAPAMAVVDACTGHPRFERLVEVGYGTENDKGAWWRYSHWVDRSAAKEILALFPGKTTFAEVLEEHRRAAEAVGVYDGEIAHHRQEIAAGEAIAKEYAAHYDEHKNLDARALERTRGRIVQHMLTSDNSMMSQRLINVPAIRNLFLRTSGLAAKLAYLDGIQRSHTAEIDRDLKAQSDKLANVEMRTRRRWAPMDAEKYAKLNADVRPRYEKRWQRFAKVYTQVNGFNRWDRGRRYDDLLWWDVMTRGRYDGSYIHEVHTFHRSHPGYVFDPELLRGRPEDPVDTSDARDEAEAAALSADDDRDGGTVSAGLAQADAS